jgi:hypothetical protein
VMMPFVPGHRINYGFPPVDLLLGDLVGGFLQLR